MVLLQVSLQIRLSTLGAIPLLLFNLASASLATVESVSKSQELFTFFQCFYGYVSYPLSAGSQYLSILVIIAMLISNSAKGGQYNWIPLLGMVISAIGTVLGICFFAVSRLRIVKEILRVNPDSITLLPLSDTFGSTALDSAFFIATLIALILQIVLFLMLLHDNKSGVTAFSPPQISTESPSTFVSSTIDSKKSSTIAWRSPVASTLTPSTFGENSVRFLSEKPSSATLVASNYPQEGFQRQSGFTASIPQPTKESQFSNLSSSTSMPNMNISSGSAVGLGIKIGPGLGSSRNDNNKTESALGRKPSVRRLASQNLNDLIETHQLRIWEAETVQKINPELLPPHLRNEPSDIVYLQKFQKDEQSMAGELIDLERSEITQAHKRHTNHERLCDVPELLPIAEKDDSDHQLVLPTDTTAQSPIHTYRTNANSNEQSQAQTPKSVCSSKPSLLSIPRVKSRSSDDLAYPKVSAPNTPRTPPREDPNNYDMQVSSPTKSTFYPKESDSYLSQYAVKSSHNTGEPDTSWASLTGAPSIKTRRGSAGSPLKKVLESPKKMITNLRNMSPTRKRRSSVFGSHSGSYIDNGDWDTDFTKFSIEDSGVPEDNHYYQ